LNHNLVAVFSGSSAVPYLVNAYGDDPKAPGFDAVSLQLIAGKPVSFQYRDLFGESAGYVLPPSNNSLAQFVDGRGEFESVQICPAPCELAPRYASEEWVPWNGELVLFAPGGRLGGIGSVASYSPRRAIPPTVVKVTRSQGATYATATTGTAGIPSDLRFTLTVPGQGIVNFAPRGDGSWTLTGSAAALDQLVLLGEISLVSQGTTLLRVYAGRPLGVAHLVDGRCGGPFRAVRNGAGQLQLTEGVCTNNLVVSPLATLVSDAGLIAAYASGNTGSLANADVFAASALVPGRYSVAWQRVPGVAGRYEPAVGPADGAAATDQMQAARKVTVDGPVFRAPAPSRAQSVPVFAFHVPTVLRSGRGSDSLLYDDGQRFFAYEVGESCLGTGTPGPARRGVGSEASGPLPDAATVVTDAYGVVWTFYYDAEGRTLRTVNHGTGAATSFNYDRDGDLVGVERPLRDRSCMRYDDDGNVILALAFPVPGALGPSQPIRARFGYQTAPARLTEIYDPREPNRIWSAYTWDELGRVETVTTADGATVSYTYDAGDSLPVPSEIHHPDGAVTLIEYDESVGLPSVVTKDAAGPAPVITVAEYDVAGRITRLQGPLGDLTELVYEDGTLRGLSRTGDDLRETMLMEVANGMPSLAVRSLGFGSAFATTEIARDGLGQAIVVTERALDGSAPQRTSCAKYGPDGRLLGQLLPDGSRVIYQYDGEGRLTSVQAGVWPQISDDGFATECPRAVPTPGEFSNGVVAMTQYDMNGRPVLVRDAAGNDTTFQYDGFGRPAIVTDARGTSHRFGYDAMGHVEWSASYDAAHAGVAYGPPAFGQAGLLAAARRFYDEVGRIVQTDEWQFDSSGAVIGTGVARWRYLYEPAANRVTVVDPSGAATSRELDGAGRPRLTTYATGDIEAFSYLEGGRVVLRQWTAPTGDGLLSERHTLTAWGAPAKRETDESGQLRLTEAWSYLDNRLPREHAVLGYVEFFGYDAFDQLRTVERYPSSSAPPEIMALDYDVAGRVVSRTSDAGNGLGPVSSTFAYDVLGRLTAQKLPGGLEEFYSYLGASALVQKRTDAAGVQFFYAYDANTLARIKAVAPQDPYEERTQEISFIRDGLGRVLEAGYTGRSYFDASDDVTTYLRWDSLGHRTAEWNSVLGVSAAVTHVPDGRGLPVSSSYAGTVVNRVFDPLGRLSEVTVVGDADPVVKFAYDGLGGPVSRTLSTGVTTSYQYDVLGRLAGLVDVAADGSTLAAWAWQQPLDGVPRTATLTRAGTQDRTSIYEVDSAGRVIGERHDASGVGLVIRPDDEPGIELDEVLHPLLRASAGWRTYTLDGRSNWLERNASDPSLEVTVGLAESDAYEMFGQEIVAYDGRGFVTDIAGEHFGYDTLGNLVEISKAGSTCLPRGMRS
jgi:YD repeat-containing protein